MAQSQIACPGCDLLLSRPHIKAGRTARCPRCKTQLLSPRRSSPERTLALAVAGLILFLPANLYPILTLEVLGLEQSNTIFASAIALLGDGLWFVTLLILLFAILVPLCKLLLLFYVSLALVRRRAYRGLRFAMRAYQHIDEWGMLEVYLLGVLVSIVKLADIASVVPGIGLYSLAGLILITVISSAQLDKDAFWRAISALRRKPGQPNYLQLGEKETPHEQ